MERIRYGMVGGGEGAFIGAVHRMAAALDGEYSLVCGAFSSDAARSQRSGEALGLDTGRSYPTLEALLAGEAALPESERMEVLAIVTPNHLHAPAAIAALDAGFHVMSDKPMALDLAESGKAPHAFGHAQRPQYGGVDDEQAKQHPGVVIGPRREPAFEAEAEEVGGLPGDGDDEDVERERQRFAVGAQPREQGVEKLPVHGDGLSAAVDARQGREDQPQVGGEAGLARVVRGESELGGQHHLAVLALGVGCRGEQLGLVAEGQ